MIKDFVFAWEGARKAVEARWLGEAREEAGEDGSDASACEAGLFARVGGTVEAVLLEVERLVLKKCRFFLWLARSVTLD